jgi:nitrite reductase/ring-hydroxylating ferredoxin subunit
VQATIRLKEGACKVLVTRHRGVLLAAASTCPRDGADLARGVLAGNLAFCPAQDCVYNLDSGEDESGLALRKLATFDVD